MNLNTTPRIKSQWRQLAMVVSAVVLLPTVCLIWVMVGAVRNEQHAFHQKLGDLYSKQIDVVTRRLDSESGSWLVDFPAANSVDPIQQYHLLNQQVDGVLIVFNEYFQMVFPALADEVGLKNTGKAMLLVNQFAASLEATGFNLLQFMAASEGAWAYLTINDEGYYAKVYEKNGFKVLRILSPELFVADHGSKFREVETELLGVRMLDRQNRTLFGGENLDSEVFSQYLLSGDFNGWKIALFIKDISFFENAAQKQSYVYIWITVLVIAVILIASVFAFRMVSHQIRVNNLKNDFLATVSHELKTPLASMRVLVDTLIEGRYKGQQQVDEYLGLVAKENIRLSRLIDNFLTFNRMERNKQSFQMRRCQPCTVAEIAIQSLGTRFSSENVDFKYDCLEPISEIDGDMDSLVTVLVNLLDNAIKYSNEEKTISLFLYPTQDNRVCYEVEDNGIGISMLDRNKIFERFVQVDRNLSRTAEGVGLGLSIVRYIVEAHKGEIQLQSRLGKGSTFKVFLPAVS